MFYFNNKVNLLTEYYLLNFSLKCKTKNSSFTRVYKYSLYNKNIAAKGQFYSPSLYIYVCYNSYLYKFR